MHRFLLSIMVVLCFAGPSFVQQSDGSRLQGTWEITSVVDEGVLVPDDLVRARYAQDGRFTIKGQTITFLTPGTHQQRTILCVLDDKVSPKTIDLGGAERTNGKGIYLLADDVLMLCIAEPGVRRRPTEFSARKGEPQLLMTLKRVKPAAVAQPRLETPAQIKDDELRKALLGTWGHQDDEWVRLFTLNADGTFGSTRTYKKKFGKLFHENMRSSGTWTLKDGVVFCTVTNSTDSDQINQVFSYRIRAITATDLLAVDQFGNLRREWKTR